MNSFYSTFFWEKERRRERERDEYVSEPFWSRSGVSEQDEEESDEVKRKAKALNKEEGKAVTKQKLTRTPSAKSLGKHITKKDGQSLTSSGVFSTGAATTSTSTTVTASTTTTTTTAPSQTAALSVPLTNPLTIPLTGSSDSPTQTQSNPKLLISPSTSSQNLTTNPKSSSTSTIPNVPLNVPIGMCTSLLWIVSNKKKNWKRKRTHFCFIKMLQISLKRWKRIHPH